MRIKNKWRRNWYDERTVRYDRSIQKTHYKKRCLYDNIKMYKFEFEGVSVKNIRQVIQNTIEENQSKTDGTKVWSVKDPVLL